MSVFPLFSLGSELCWDTTGLASSFELRHQCQDPQALAVGQEGRPPWLGWENLKCDTLRHHFQELYPIPQEKYPPYTYPHKQRANAEMPTEGSTPALDGFKKACSQSISRPLIYSSFSNEIISSSLKVEFGGGEQEGGG